MELLGIPFLQDPSGRRGCPSRLRRRELCALGGLAVNSDFVLATVDFPARHHSQVSCYGRGYTHSPTRTGGRANDHYLRLGRSASTLPESERLAPSFTAKRPCRLWSRTWGICRR